MPHDCLINKVELANENRRFGVHLRFKSGRTPFEGETFKRSTAATVNKSPRGRNSASVGSRARKRRPDVGR